MYAGGLVTVSFSIRNPITDVSSLNFNDLLAAGTSSNNNPNTMLNYIASGMQELKASGVIVIFRIYQESYGNWFWWGITRLSDPGAAYEDIVGQDLYTSSPARDGATPYNNLLQLNKIVAIGEFGSGNAQLGER